MYLLHHEEIESLAKNIPGVKRIRFFMTFGQSYLTHMKCLENVGLLHGDRIVQCRQCPCDEDAVGSHSDVVCPQ